MKLQSIRKKSRISMLFGVLMFLSLAVAFNVQGGSAANATILVKIKSLHLDYTGDGWLWHGAEAQIYDHYSNCIGDYYGKHWEEGDHDINLDIGWSVSYTVGQTRKYWFYMYDDDNGAYPWNCDKDDLLWRGYLTITGLGLSGDFYTPAKGSTASFASGNIKLTTDWTDSGSDYNYLEFYVNVYSVIVF